MELRHLRYFVAVAEELHFGRAAERLYIAQPPLSQQIQQLERELGFALFTRTSRQVNLTDAGRVFLEEARRILADVEQAVQKAGRASQGETGWLGIGFVASATHHVLPDVLREFRRRYPDVELGLWELTTAEQVRALRAQEIHIGFARPAMADEMLEVEPISREPLVIAVPEQHPLSRESVVSLASLADEAFILYPRDPKPSYADFVIGICELSGFSPRVAQETLQMQTAISLVAAGIGVTLVPASIQNLQRIGVAYRPLREVTAVTELSAAYRRADGSPVLANFLAIMRAVCGPGPEIP